MYLPGGGNDAVYVSATALGTGGVLVAVSLNSQTLWVNRQASGGGWFAWARLGSVNQQSIGVGRYPDGKLIVIATDTARRSTYVSQASSGGRGTRRRR